jgi:hypothetical protein
MYDNGYESVPALVRYALSLWALVDGGGLSGSTCACMHLYLCWWDCFYMAVIIVVGLGLQYPNLVYLNMGSG